MHQHAPPCTSIHNDIVSIPLTAGNTTMALCPFYDSGQNSDMVSTTELRYASKVSKKVRYFLTFRISSSKSVFDPKKVGVGLDRNHSKMSRDEVLCSFVRKEPARASMFSKSKRGTIPLNPDSKNSAKIPFPWYIMFLFSYASDVCQTIWSQKGSSKM